MNKENIVHGVWLLLLFCNLPLILVLDDIQPLVFDFANTLFDIPLNLFLWFFGINTIICLLICWFYWKNRYFNCQNSCITMPTNMEFIMCMFMTFSGYSMVIMLSLLGSFIYLNAKLDNSQPYTIATMVILKECACDKYKEYYVTVQQADHSTITLRVSGENYRSINVNDKLIITAKHGYFNVPWQQSFYIEKQKSFL